MTSEYERGYADGLNGHDYDSSGSDNYNRGYDAGDCDRDNGWEFADVQKEMTDPLGH